MMPLCGRMCNFVTRRNDDGPASDTFSTHCGRGLREAGIRESFLLSGSHKEFRFPREGQLGGRGLETIPSNPPKREFGV